MELDFENTEEISDFVSVPSGTYLCRVVEVRERVTKGDDTLWALRLAVAEGEFTGRHASWDNLVFSIRGLSRVRRVLTALGLPSDGKVNIEPDDLVGKVAFVQVRPAEYMMLNGNMTRRNEVPYYGYQAVPAGDGMAGDGMAGDGSAGAGTAMAETADEPWEGSREGGEPLPL